MTSLFVSMSFATSLDFSVVSVWTEGSQPAVIIQRAMSAAPTPVRLGLGSC